MGESLEVETDWMAARLGPICFGKMAPRASLWRQSAEAFLRVLGSCRRGAGWALPVSGLRVEATVQRVEAEPG